MLAGTAPTTSVKVYVWIIFFLLIVLFALSLIYWLLDVGQYFLDRSNKKKKEVIDQQISEDSEEPIKTDSDDYNEQKPGDNAEKISTREIYVR